MLERVTVVVSSSDVNGFHCLLISCMQPALVCDVQTTKRPKEELLLLLLFVVVVVIVAVVAVVGSCRLELHHSDEWNATHSPSPSEAHSALSLRRADASSRLLRIDRVSGILLTLVD